MNKKNLMIVLAILASITISSISAIAGSGHGHAHATNAASADDGVAELGADELEPGAEEAKGAEYFHDDNRIELPDDPVYGNLSLDLIDELYEDGEVDEANSYIRPESTTDGRIVVGGTGIDGRWLNMAKGEVMITIDDGPTKGVTTEVIRMLNEYNIRALFFVVGNRIAKRTSVMEMMKNAQSSVGSGSEYYFKGHLVGNHTYRHELDFSNTSAMYGSFNRANSTVAPYIPASQKRCYIRTPGGVWNDWRKDNINSHASLRQCIGPFYWNIGGGKATADWNCWAKGKSASTCAQGYYNELRRVGRGVILLHDLNKNTVPLLKQLLQLMQREGIKNANGGRGFWKFVDPEKLSELDKLEVVPDAYQGKRY